MILKSLKDILMISSGEGLAIQFETLLPEGVSIDSRTVKKGR
ncbi:hypothetical protein ACIQXV_08305 [Neobacillus sp. NPDC097160]